MEGTKGLAKTSVTRVQRGAELIDARMNLIHVIPPDHASLFPPQD